MCICSTKLRLDRHTNVRVDKIMQQIFSKYHFIGWVCVWLLTVNTFAQEKTIYKTVDEKGRTVFTDNPPVHKKVEAVDLKQTNIQPGGQRYSSRGTDQPQQDLSTSISIVSPTAEAKLGPADKSVTFRARVNRRLMNREGIVFYLDGNALNTASSATSYTMPLSVKIRGKHAVTAKVVNKNTGNTLATSSPVGFYVIRATSR